ncbi:unnamed protein product, partial [Allacma fusca]
ARSEFN